MKQRSEDMPLWHIYTPVDAYSTEDKGALSAALMSLYVDAGLPKFYVNVLFHEVAEENYFIGGQPRNNFVRLVGEHIARQLPTTELRRKALARLEANIAPFVKDRGYDWEIHIDETPFDFWQVQGLVPPPAESEAEMAWAQQDRPIPYGAV
jgi:phenylpyruvate tautomerase PptA (4-oxalocrotonate tautomerase family)